MMEELKIAEDFKTAGNECFQQGDIAAAVESYQKAISLTEPFCKDIQVPKASMIIDLKAVTDDNASVDSLSECAHAALVLRGTLFSNLSNLFLSQKEFTKSWEAAASAIALQPKSIKPWMRYVEARRQGGFPFDAFVTQLRYVRPLVRCSVQEGILTPAEGSTLLARVETPLFRVLGLSEVHEGLELIHHMNGVALVLRQSIKANHVLFVEKKFSTPFDHKVDEEEDSDDNNTEASLRNEKSTVYVVSQYAKRLRPHQIRKSEEWISFQAQMKGAWPRNIQEDITPEMLMEIEPALRKAFPDVEKKEFSELMHTALICRCNGFQNGFFRVCALANHSCVANSAMKFRPSQQSVVMIAVKDIHANESILVKYLSDADFLMGLGKRRDYLHSWHFWCQCSRCLEDQQEDADIEKISCPSCGEYVVHPFTPNPSAEDKELLEICAKPCGSCGASLVNWKDQHSPMLYSLLTHMTESTQMTTAAALTDWMHRTLEEIVLLDLHPCHWLYRILFYFYCFAVVEQILPSVLKELKNGNRSSDVVSSVFHLNGVREIYINKVLKNFVSSITDSPTKGSSRGSTNPNSTLITSPVFQSLCYEGCDAVLAFIIFFHHISSFYPLYELWAAHKTICHLLLFQIIYQDEKSTEKPLTIISAMDLLQKHSQYLGSDDTAELMLFFSENKQFAVDSKSLPKISRLKKVLQ